MNKISTLSIFLLVFAMGFSQQPKKSETVAVNGKNIYYEVYGEGSPLFLFHGYTLSSQSWKSHVVNFEKDYEVYLVDLTGHGKSDAFKETLSIKSVAKDVQALVHYLKLEKIKAIGFSFGGDMLYQLALLQPSLMDAMITIGAVGTWTIDDFPEYQQVFTFENKDNFPWLASSHRNDEQIRQIMLQFKNYKVALSDQELQKIRPEVLIITGDNDEGMDFTEIARVKKNLPKSDLWILPNVSHAAHEGETKEDFTKKSKAFFSKKRNN